MIKTMVAPLITI